MFYKDERLALFIRHLQDVGVTEVAFAGAVARPRLDPALFDPDTAQIVPRLLAAMGQGDDATLREVLAIFEEAGFAIAGVPEIAPALVPSVGVLAGTLTPRDEKDAERAAAIVSAGNAIGAGLAMTGMIGAGIGIGNIFGNFLSGALRNPSAAGSQIGNLFVGAALAEALGILSFVIGILLWTSAS